MVSTGLVMRLAPNSSGEIAVLPNALANSSDCDSFQCDDGVELAQAHFGEGDAVKLKIAVARLDVENAHHAVATCVRLDPVIGAEHGRAKEFFGALGLRRLGRGRKACRKRRHKQREGRKR